MVIRNLRADLPPELPTILQLGQLAASFDDLGDGREAGELRLCATLVEERAMPLEQARKHLEVYRALLRDRLRNRHPVRPIGQSPRPMT